MQLASQLGAAAALSTVWMGLKYLTKRKPNELILNEFKDLWNAYPGFMVDVSPLSQLFHDDKTLFRKFLTVLDDIRVHDTNMHDDSQWHIMRLSTKAQAIAEDMVNRAPKEQSDAIYRQALLCSDDVLPQIQVHLDSIIHNHLLLRADKKKGF